MSSNSQYLLESYTHPGDSTTETVTGDAIKGDGYYGRSDGLHTVQYNYTGFTGSFTTQATLEINPTDDDWFNVDILSVNQNTGSRIANFTGNYVWIRVVVVYTDGTVNSVLLNN